MGGWMNRCEIAHAVADSPESAFEFRDVVFAPRPGFFDATTCHNPTVHFVDGKYCLFYFGNSNGKTDTKRIGLATTNSLNGPWKRPDGPLLEVGEPGSWDDHCTSNPSFVRHPNGQYWLYHKSWNTAEYQSAPKEARVKGNRKYGLAVADKLNGPYRKHPGNPVVDYSGRGADNQQLEDAYAWHQDGRSRFIARDMGFYEDRLLWDEPLCAGTAGAAASQPVWAAGTAATADEWRQAKIPLHGEPGRPVHDRERLRLPHRLMPLPFHVSYRRCVLYRPCSF